MRTPVLAVAVLATGLAAQKTYFADAARGADTNPGTTRAQPWKSITKASKTMRDGDTLVVLPGTYSASRTGEVYPIKFGDRGANASQNRIRILGEGGPAVTILDGEKKMTSSDTPIIRFFWDADGASISGITLRNTGTADYWTMAIRIGAPWGGNLSCRNVEVHGCVFRDVRRAIVVFGTDPTLGAQTTGIKIHDNLIVSAAHRAIAMWGDGKNASYNNTIVGSGHDGIWVSSLFGQKSASLIANNIVTGGKVGGIAIGAPGATATFVNNNSFGNATNYRGFTPGSSNTSVDPKFVSATDHHLQAGSPMIETGTNAVPLASRDLDRFSRLHDADRDNLARTDKGAYEFHTIAMAIGGTWAPGGAGVYTFTAPATNAGAVLLAARSGVLELQPFGVFLLDQTALYPVALSSRIPGSVRLPIPNNSSLLGATIASQGAALSPAQLLNGDERTL